MPALRQRIGQVPRRLRRPDQQRHRVPASFRSAKALSCNNNPGSDSARLFRPPPGARTRTAGSASPANSRTPRAIVSGCTPVAAATTLIPPLPNSCASAPETVDAAAHAAAGQPVISVDTKRKNWSAPTKRWQGIPAARAVTPIDLIAHSVQAESDGLDGLTAVKVVDQCHGCLMRHSVPQMVTVTDLTMMA